MMENAENQNPESAGTIFGIVSAIIFAFVGILKVLFFSQVAIINVVFLQGMITLLLFYICCREFDVSPFIEEDEDKHFGLKISAILYLVGGLLYLYSWNFWGREYSHFIIALLPAIMLALESRNRVIGKNEAIFFGLNLAGMFILLAIPDSIKPATLLGFGISLAGVAIMFAGFIKMGKSQGNFLSMGIVYNLFIVIFVPAFFAIQAGTPPNILEVLVIMLLGVLSFFGIVLAIRSS